MDTNCAGDWVGSRAGLDRSGKSRLHRDSIPGPSIPWGVAIPTELSRSIIIYIILISFEFYVVMVFILLYEGQG